MIVTPPRLSQVVTKVFLLVLALFALLIVAIWAMGWFRRNVLLKRDEKEKEPAYTMTQLQEMYEDGIITGEEFERLKRKISGHPYLT